MSLERYPAPERLRGVAAEGWAAVVSAVPRDRDLSRADLVRVEAAARAYARWRRTEDKLEEVASTAGGLAGEFVKDKSGTLGPSALRVAAREAFEEYLRLSEGFGQTSQVNVAQFDRDLFGDPIPKKRAGRPAHIPTRKNRDKVLVLLALGWQSERIANALHVSLPTLHKHYRKELKARGVQRDRLDAWRMECAAQAAAGGNVGAMRLLDKLIEKNDRILNAAKVDRESEEKEHPRLGKKAAAKKSAEQVLQEGWGGDLSPESYH